MDTDVLLQPAQNAGTKVEALKDVVEANTAAFKEVRVDLDTCNNVDKVRAIMAKVEKAMEDLSMTSQKVQQAIEKASDGQSLPYGQYPINQPLNRDNPVPRVAPPPVVTGNIKMLSAVDADTAAIDMPPGHYSRFTNGDQVTIDGTGTPVDGSTVTLANGDGKDTFQCQLVVKTTASKGTISKGG